MHLEDFNRRECSWQRIVANECEHPRSIPALKPTVRIVGETTVFGEKTTRLVEQDLGSRSSRRVDGMDENLTFLKQQVDEARPGFIWTVTRIWAAVVVRSGREIGSWSYSVASARKGRTRCGCDGHYAWETREQLSWEEHRRGDTQHFSISQQFFL